MPIATFKRVAATLASPHAAEQLRVLNPFLTDDDVADVLHGVTATVIITARLTHTSRSIVSLLRLEVHLQQLAHSHVRQRWSHEHPGELQVSDELLALAERRVGAHPDRLYDTLVDMLGVTVTVREVRCGGIRQLRRLPVDCTPVAQELASELTADMTPLDVKRAAMLACCACEFDVDASRRLASDATAMQRLVDLSRRQCFARGGESVANVRAF